VQDRPNPEADRGGLGRDAGLWGSYGPEGVRPRPALLVHPSGFGSPGPRFKFGQPHTGPIASNGGRSRAVTEPAHTATSVPVAAGTLYCEVCGRTTPHRILRVAPGATVAGVRGLARCRVCRLTHPFVSAAERKVEVDLIVSGGGTSRRVRIALPAETRLAPGRPLPGPMARLEVTRLDGAGGKAVTEASAGSVRTIWAVEPADRGIALAVSEGRGRVVSRRLQLPSSVRLEVGGWVEVDGSTVILRAIRARGRTWHRGGIAFSPEEIEVAYGWRTVSPPAGRSPWSTVRETPRSRARSTSTRDRSRSSPGTSRARRRPRASRAEGGATVHRSSPP
jgi:uncharacterized Zn finger protein